MVIVAKDQEHNLSSPTWKKLGKASKNNLSSPVEKKFGKDFKEWSIIFYTKDIVQIFKEY